MGEGDGRQEVTFHPLPNCPTVVLRTAQGGVWGHDSWCLSFVAFPGTPASSTADAAGSRRFAISGALLGIRACGLRAKMPEGADAPGGPLTRVILRARQSEVPAQSSEVPGSLGLQCARL